MSFTDVVNPSHEHLDDLVPVELRDLAVAQSSLPRVAKDPVLSRKAEVAAQGVPTAHQMFLADARDASFLRSGSVHLVLTSPPYWTLKTYRESAGQLGHVEDYASFVQQIDRVWQHCYRALVPGGRLVCVVGDVCLARRKNGGRHTVVPLHASIQEHCRDIGFDNLAPIIWYKIANARYEVGRGGGFLGKPYEPNAVIKNDIEYILMLRKPGAYRRPTLSARVMSVIPQPLHRVWFQQIWTGLPGASTQDHPAPYPSELAERLVRMFSFVGDTVLDPFSGTATTSLAAARWGRNSIGIEIDSHYFTRAVKRLRDSTNRLFTRATVEEHVAWVRKSKQE